MIIVCPSCQSRYKFDESKFGERQRAKTKCAKCGSSIEIENPAMSDMTLPPTPLPGKGAPAAPPAPAPRPPEDDTKRRRAEEGPGMGTITGKDLHKAGVVELPKDKRFSLAVIQGAATGQIFQITKTRTVLAGPGPTSTSTTPRPPASTPLWTSWATTPSCATSDRPTAPSWTWSASSRRC